MTRQYKVKGESGGVTMTTPQENNSTNRGLLSPTHRKSLGSQEADATGLTSGSSRSGGTSAAINSRGTLEGETGCAEQEVPSYSFICFLIL